MEKVQALNSNIYILDSLECNSESLTIKPETESNNVLLFANYSKSSAPLRVTSKFAFDTKIEPELRVKANQGFLVQ